MRMSMSVCRVFSLVAFRKTAIACAVLLGFPAMASASGATRRSDAQTLSAALQASGSSRRQVPAPRQNRRHTHRRPAPVVILPPYYYYPPYYHAPYYFAPQPVTVDAPFFCIEHRTGFVSRVGLIDHLGGIHKLPLSHAAAICPDGVEECIIEGY
jgi:hypothetical protein